MECRNRVKARVLCRDCPRPVILARTLILSIAISWAANASGNPQLSGPQGEPVDIGNAALAFAREAYPDLNTAAYSRRLDELSRRVLIQANGSTDSGGRIAALNGVLFTQEGYHYDHRPEARSDLSNYFLTGIMDSKRGTCYTMPLLYVAVAQRAGYPVYFVAAPDHLFARYVDPSGDIRNVEVTSGGRAITDASYIRDFSIGPQGVSSGSYMRTLSYRQAVGHMCGAMAVYYAASGRWSRAARSLRRAISLNPLFADNYQSLAELHNAVAEHSPHEKARSYRALAWSEVQKAKSLGYVGAEDVNAGREARQR